MKSQNGRNLDLSTGILSLNDQQQEYLDWLCGAKPEGESQAAFARRMGVHETTVLRWKKDRSFIRLWQERMVETHAHPDTLSKQLKVLNEKACAGDVKAIELYWKLVDRMTPDRLEVTGTEQVAGMSDAELADRLQKAAVAAVDRAKPESPQEIAARVRADLGLKAV